MSPDVSLSTRTSPFDLFPRETPPPDAKSEHRVLTIGISIWIVAALSLVAGIVVGFASGYTAGRRNLPASTPGPAAAGDGLPELSPAYEPRQPPATFTEGTVSEPVRVDREPIVAAPEAAPAPAERSAAPAPETRAPVDPAPAPPPAARAPVDPAVAPARDLPVPAPVTTGPGSLQVLSRPPGANVIVDGQLIGQTPLVLSDVQAGAHDVRIELDGFRVWSTSVDVRPGARARVAASLEQ